MTQYKPGDTVPAGDYWVKVTVPEYAYVDQYGDTAALKHTNRAGSLRTVFVANALIPAADLVPRAPQPKHVFKEGPIDRDSPRPPDGTLLSYNFAGGGHRVAGFLRSLDAWPLDDSVYDLAIEKLPAGYDPDAPEVLTEEPVEQDTRIRTNDGVEWVLIDASKDRGADRWAHTKVPLMSRWKILSSFAPVLVHRGWSGEQS